MNAADLRWLATSRPLARLANTITSVISPAIMEQLQELRAAALAQTEARQVNAAKTAIALVRITLKGALEQVERVENDIADHWHKCLERETNGKDSIQ
ncbi:MAG: hypothetical protein U0270_07655 [Labilithrix sp.]